MAWPCAWPCSGCCPAADRLPGVAEGRSLRSARTGDGQKATGNRKWALRGAAVAAASDTFRSPRISEGAPQARSSLRSPVAVACRLFGASAAATLTASCAGTPKSRGLVEAAHNDLVAPSQAQTHAWYSSPACASRGGRSHIGRLHAPVARRPGGGGFSRSMSRRGRRVVRYPSAPLV